MTNAQKFKDVFGTNLERHYITKSWWEEEYKPPKSLRGHWRIDWNPNGTNTMVACICSCCGKKSRIPWGYYCEWCGVKMEV